MERADAALRAYPIQLCLPMILTNACFRGINELLRLKMGTHSVGPEFFVSILVGIPLGYFVQVLVMARHVALSNDATSTVRVAQAGIVESWLALLQTNVALQVLERAEVGSYAVPARASA